MKVMANEKSRAEQYRDERKARIAKAAKKNASKIEKSTAVRKTVGRVIAIVLAAVIVLGALGLGLSYYGVPQRLIVLGKVGNDQKVTIAEYEYYYMTAYNQLYNMAAQYQQYGYDYGFDTSLAPEDQTGTTQDEDGNEITWSEYLHNQAVAVAQQNKAYYNEAVKAGIKLDKADEQQIENIINDYKEEANPSDTDDTSSDSQRVKYSLNAWLRKLFGGSVNKRFLRKELRIQLLAQKYITERTKELAKGYEQSEIDKTYNADKDTYDMVDFRYYRFANEELTQNENETEADFNTRKAKAEAKVKADAVAFDKVAVNESAFVAEAKKLNSTDESYDVDSSTKTTSALKSDIEQNFSADIAKWLFDSSTKAGAKKMFTDTDAGTYYIILLLQPKHQVDTVSSRHILFKTVDDSNNPLSNEEVAAAKKKAEDTLKEWKSGDKTEESFAALANELTEDTGSNTKGGLYEHQRPGQMVKEFDAWNFDANRKTGDVEIVKTEYGYHVIYFVSKDGKYYNNAIRDSKASEDVSQEAEKLIKGDDYKVYFGKRCVPYAENRMKKKIKSLVELRAANSSSTAS